MCCFRKLRAWCDAQRFDEAGKNAVRLEKVIVLFFMWSVVAVFFNVFVMFDFWSVISFAVWCLVLLIGWHGALKRNTASLAAFNMLMMFKVLMFLFMVVFLLAFASAMVVVPIEMGMEMEMHQEAINEANANAAAAAFHDLAAPDAVTPDTPDTPVSNLNSEEGGKIMDTEPVDTHFMETTPLGLHDLESPPMEVHNYMDVAIVRHVMMHFMMFGASSIFGIFVYVLVYLYPLVLMLCGIFFAGRARNHLLMQRYTAELLSRHQASQSSHSVELHQAPAPSPVNNMFPQQTPYPASPVVMYYAPVPSAPGKQ
jgi:hypothetical protein